MSIISVNKFHEYVKQININFAKRWKLIELYIEDDLTNLVSEELYPVILD